ncbi:uncharacterized protein EDB93DRAFT_1129733 [Suillus bovinus]|uniref:uncharacterized protein n=1 Tax=Suillus bovinus TaxID=48563 RepID=UPI001B86F910|nr:uncharacterized protein EDB93DRAFT_1129733 [Suillus bovinus]KAG2155263.1 hypothetical protein EDB93DRAFT_1129733 [Suillus bovinus]
MLFYSFTILACILSIVARAAAASPTKRDHDVSVYPVIDDVTVDALDRRDDLMVRVDVDTNSADLLSQKRGDDSLLGVVIGVNNVLNNATISVLR